MSLADNPGHLQAPATLPQAGIKQEGWWGDAGPHHATGIWAVSRQACCYLALAHTLIETMVSNAIMTLAINKVHIHQHDAMIVLKILTYQSVHYLSYTVQYIKYLILVILLLRQFLDAGATALGGPSRQIRYCDFVNHSSASFCTKWSIHAIILLPVEKHYQTSFLFLSLLSCAFLPSVLLFQFFALLPLSLA